MPASYSRTIRTRTVPALAGLALAVGSPAHGQAPSHAPVPDRPRPWPATTKTLDLDRDSDLDTYIRQRMLTGRLPSVQACVIHDDAIIWAGAYGLANIQPEIPATLDTLYLIASNSKPVAATAVMKLYDQGTFGLDDPVDDHVAFPVRHPDHPDTPITPRMLLSHTAAIDDDWEGSLLNLVVGGDSPIPLGAFLEDYLVPGGAYYAYPGSYLAGGEPGAAFHYTNVGFTLGAYLVEPLTGTDFAEHCNEHLFAPLDMHETRWFLRELDPLQLAMPYYYDENLERYVAYGHTSWPAYPSACLRTSVLQQARILRAQMNGGRSGGVPVLEPMTVAQMQAVQTDDPTIDYGLGLYRTYGFDGRLWIGHDGYWWGNRTYMYFRPADNIGVITFTNGDPIVGQHELEFAEIFFRLADEFDQTCPGDLDDDGDVDFADVLGLLSTWGACTYCREDLNHDGVVDFTDLLAVLTSWGPCSHMDATGPLGPIGSGAVRTHTFAGLPPAAGAVTLSFNAVADLGDPSEAIDVNLGGTLLGTVFAAGASDCPGTPDAAALVLSAATFNELAPGSAVLTLQPTAAVDPLACDGFSYVEARVEYVPEP